MRNSTSVLSFSAPLARSDFRTPLTQHGHRIARSGLLRAPRPQQRLAERTPQRARERDGHRVADLAVLLFVPRYRVT